MRDCWWFPVVGDFKTILPLCYRWSNMVWSRQALEAMKNALSPNNGAFHFGTRIT
jgi:hypothetical protein